MYITLPTLDPLYAVGMPAYFMGAGGGQNGGQGAQYVIDSGAGAHYAGTREAQRALVERRESHGWVVTASGDKYEYRECGTAYVTAKNGGVVRIEDVKVWT